jgi:hypothetical protein
MKEIIKTSWVPYESGFYGSCYSANGNLVGSITLSYDSDRKDLEVNKCRVLAFEFNNSRWDFDSFSAILPVERAMKFGEEKLIGLLSQ